MEEEGIENNFQIAFSVKYFSLDRRFSSVLRVTSVVCLSEPVGVGVNAGESVTRSSRYFQEIQGMVREGADTEQKMETVEVEWFVTLCFKHNAYFFFLYR